MSKLIDLTGQQFYEWTVVKKAEHSKNGGTRWYCKCSCGKTGIVGGYDLKNGGHKSCGHDRKRTIKDIKGNTYGDLRVLEYKNKGKWECLCVCGNKVEVASYSLTSGHTKSCGHNTSKFKDLTGKTFGEWTALKYTGNSLWECKCSCGTVSNISGYSLRSGGTKSCGHGRVSSKLEDLKGKQFNQWTVLKYTGNSLWECECSCGKVSNVAAYDLKMGNSRNCGHDRKTPYKDLTGMKFGELTVMKYLYKNRYICQCSCGQKKEIMGTNLLSGSTVSCGCKYATVYTEEFMRETILNYESLTGIKPFTEDLSNTLGVTSSYVNQLLNKYDLKRYMNKSFGSSYECEIYNMIKGFKPDLEILNNDRTIIGNGKELDIYIPSNKLAIEFNGDYWHSEDMLGSKYHQQKTIDCAKKGIQLIHIFEHQWLDNKTNKKLVRLIKSKVDTSNLRRVYARKCDIRQLDNKEERDFINEYHLQNYVSSTVAYGLILDNEIISVMTFGRPRFNKSVEWELLRYCTKEDIAIVGGAEKLFKHFLDDTNSTSVISYCDISKFTGGVYNKLGFKATIEDITEPNYVWVKYGDTERMGVLNRYQTRKKKLLDLGYGDYGNTESEIMGNMGYIKVYDSGNLRFIWDRGCI